MSEKVYLINSTTLTDIADAIREKLNISGTIATTDIVHKLEEIMNQPGDDSFATALCRLGEEHQIYMIDEQLEKTTVTSPINVVRVTDQGLDPLSAPCVMGYSSDYGYDSPYWMNKYPTDKYFMSTAGITQFEESLHLNDITGGSDGVAVVFKPWDEPLEYEFIDNETLLAMEPDTEQEFLNGNVIIYRSWEEE